MFRRTPRFTHKNFAVLVINVLVFVFCGFDGAVAAVDGAPEEKRVCAPACGHGEGKADLLCSHARESLIAKRGIPIRAMNREADADTDVTHYSLDIRVMPQMLGPSLIDVAVEGACTITASPTVNGLSRFTIDLRSNLIVESVTGDLATYLRSGDTILVMLDRSYDVGESFQVTVVYSGSPDSSGFAAFKWWMRAGYPVIATLSEPYYAHYWWPCKDALNDKATFDTTITVPDPLVAVSNGIDLGAQPLPDNETRYSWQVTYPMIPYLLSMAITAYERYDLEWMYDAGQGPMVMPVPCYVYPDHWDFNQDQPYASHKTGCDELPDMLEALSSVYGLYPFVEEKYGVVETGGSGGIGASMEHQTISSMSRVSNFTDIMTHELAHQWWGDEVTCETWYDIWLNEGFATFSEAYYRELRDGDMAAYWQRMETRRPGSPRNQVYRTSINFVGDIFSGNDVYEKGAWVLHMLRGVLGDEAFEAAINDYRSTFAHDSVTTAEFAAAISASFGNDLTWFVDQWVMNPGAPDYRWKYETQTIDGRRFVKVAIEQTQDAQGYGLIVMPIVFYVETPSQGVQKRVFNDEWSEYYIFEVPEVVVDVHFDEAEGVATRNWILANSVVKELTSVSAPPVIIDIRFDPFADVGNSTLELIFSENIGSLEVSDVTLGGVSFGEQVPASIAYDVSLQRALLTFVNLPDDTYFLTIHSTGIMANGLPLDGEIDDSGWWDDVLFPSGDGTPGGDGDFTLKKRTGDSDGNGVVDLSDFAFFGDCLTGPVEGTYGERCAAFDFDVDGDVDLKDMADLGIVFESN